MPKLLKKQTLAALDLTLKQLSLPFISEQGDEKFPDLSLDNFLTQRNSMPIENVAKSEISQIKPSFLNRIGEWMGAGVKESCRVSHK